MTMRYFFSAGGEYLGGFDAGSINLVPAGAQEWPTAANGGDRLVSGAIVPYTPPVDPLAEITAAVLILPVAKRTDATWGAFVGQCLLAVQHNDMEALGYLLDNHTFIDADYLAIIGQAKELFGLQ